MNLAAGKSNQQIADNLFLAESVEVIMTIKDLIEFAKINGLDESTELMISFEDQCNTNINFEKN